MLPSDPLPESGGLEPIRDEQEAHVTLPTEPIGSIPRPKALQDGMQAAAAGRISEGELEALFDDAVRDTLRRFEETGSPVVTDGEQRKPSFATYPIAGLTDLAPGRRDDPLRGRSHAPAAGPHGRSVQLRDEGVVVPRCGPRADHRPAQAGSHLGVGAQPPVSAGWDRRVPARGLPRRPGRRGGLGDPWLHRAGRDRPDRLHRSPPVAQARSVPGAARLLRRSEQPRPRAAHRRRAGAGGRPHLPRR